MRHTTDFIADSMFLDRETSKKVALENQDRFGVIVEAGQPTVGTFHANDFVAAVREAQGDETQAIRKRRIAELHPPAPANLPLDTRPSKG